MSDTLHTVYKRAIRDRQFLDDLLADPEKALRKANIGYTAEDLSQLHTQLNTTYKLTGADLLKKMNEGLDVGIIGPWLIGPWQVLSPKDPHAP